MFLLIKNYDNNKLILSEKQKNTILPGSDFYRLYYSDENVTLNGIYLEYKITNVNIQKYFNKIKCNFNLEKNTDIIENILQLETNILNNFKMFINKKQEFIIKEQLNQGFIKIFTEKDIVYGKYKDINLILKISGLWVQEKSYGLTFRFLINRQ